MDLKKAILSHKERRKTDNDAIMTVVLKEVKKTAGVKPVLDDLVKHIFFFKLFIRTYFSQK
jgi:hypothetical protein